VGVYDVKDLVKRRVREGAKDPEAAMARLVDRIKKKVEPGTWDDEEDFKPGKWYEGTDHVICGIDGTLVVRHRREVHQQVQAFLDELRREAKP